MPSLIDITGNKYNRLTVVRKMPTDKLKRTMWLCKCDCGGMSTVNGTYLKTGRTKSCGCYQKEQAREARLEHGRASKIDRHSDIYKEYSRETHLMRKYKLPIERYNQMLKEQDNKCKICSYEFGQKQGDIYVDHCHATKEVRGLLCQGCNSGLGYFKDNKDALAKAIDYLNKGL
jgi:hypothetical protein